MIWVGSVSLFSSAPPVTPLTHLPIACQTASNPGLYIATFSTKKKLRQPEQKPKKSTKAIFIF